MAHRFLGGLLSVLGGCLVVAGCTAEQRNPTGFSGDGGASAATVGSGGPSRGATTNGATTSGAGGGMSGGGGEAPVAETTAESLARQQQANGWGPSLCTGAPNGVASGLLDEQHAPSDLTFKDCEGNDVTLAELCGADAVWLFFAHAWCPSCRSTASRAEMLHDGFAGQNVASVQIVVENGSGGPADADVCRRWRDEYGHGDVLTLFDPNDHHTPLVEGGYTALNVVLDERHVITPKFHSSSQPTIEAAIDAAIAR